MGERLSFIGLRKAVKGKAMVANRILGNPTVRDEKGGFGKHGRCVTSVRAPEFYSTTLLIGRNGDGAKGVYCLALQIGQPAMGEPLSKARPRVFFRPSAR